MQIPVNSYYNCLLSNEKLNEVTLSCKITKPVQSLTHECPRQTLASTQGGLRGIGTLPTPLGEGRDAVTGSALQLPQFLCGHPLCVMSLGEEGCSHTGLPYLAHSPAPQSALVLASAFGSPFVGFPFDDR